VSITRRDFLKYCSISAAALGLTASDLLHMEQALANPTAPTILWLQGASCTGCSESFLNRFSTTAPTTAADTLINSVNLAYHPNLMSIAGQGAVDVINAAYTQGNYILAVEGGVPTAFGGAACWAYTDNGVDVTFKDAVTRLAGKAAKILAIGTCASFGGIPASGANPAGIQSVKTATGKATINIAGCATHPDWIVWTIVQLLTGKAIPLDSNGRPTGLFSGTVHSRCPRRDLDDGSYGHVGCLESIGCRGPATTAMCPVSQWNNGVNWCIGANVPCLGCTEPTFPGTNAFYRPGSG
jgi:hydrogenase small subunit